MITLAGLLLISFRNELSHSQIDDRIKLTYARIGCTYKTKLSLVSTTLFKVPSVERCRLDRHFP